MIPFGEWLPDLPDRDNPGATEAKGVYPELRSYRPWRDLAVLSNALDSACLGAVSGSDPSGNYSTFAGDAGKLYQLGNTTWTDVSKSGGYTVATDEFWSFAAYNNGALIAAANINDPIQAWTLGTSSAFADLSATAPKARYLATVRDFLCAANVNDTSDGLRPTRVAWGPIGNPGGVWTPSATTQADYQDLATGGEIVGYVGGEYGVIICRDSIYRQTYVGSPVIFQFDEVSKDKGCVAAGSVAQVGRYVFFLAEDGFYAFNGESLEPIGTNKVDNYFLADADSNGYGLITSTVDPARKLYIVYYPSSGQSSSDKALIYNWEIKRWSRVDQVVERVVRLFEAGYTLEQLDNISVSIDSLPASLDSRRWVGGALQMSAFNSSHQLCTLDGDRQAAILETAEAMLSDPRRTFVTGVRPVIDGGTKTIQIGTRNLPDDSVTWGTATSLNSRTGMADMRSDARYHRARVNVAAAGTWEHAQGVDYEANPSGAV